MASVVEYIKFLNEFEKYLIIKIKKAESEIGLYERNSREDYEVRAEILLLQRLLSDFVEMRKRINQQGE
jgi:hypothetical protein